MDQIINGLWLVIYYDNLPFTGQCEDLNGHLKSFGLN